MIILNFLSVWVSENNTTEKESSSKSQRNESNSREVMRDIKGSEDRDTKMGK